MRLADETEDAARENGRRKSAIHKSGMRDFLSRHSISEEYVASLARIANNVQELLSAYRNKKELIEDISEAAPFMKPATRRRLWIAIVEEKRAREAQELRNRGLRVVGRSKREY